ncbi:hypothetical protein L3Y34_005357 [Caenorhabditis briggsae]|uniref:Brinker DNA-binding domain-containing protein n=1 Tax=Caenorhabditis briggsae TaxID=6238 RepID=A0AAE9AEH4_CAEBR|nr:hypothetical protein L3Y34_005357 [Caenorhabditis briggsae]
MEETVKEEPREEETPETPQKFRRQNYTLEFKTQVVEFAEKTNNCQASTLFGVPRQCIQNWRRVKEEFLNAEEPFGKPKKQMKRLKGGGRKLKNAEMDQKMEKWLKEKEEIGEKITGTMIKEYAISISGDSEFREYSVVATFSGLGRQTGKLKSSTTPINALHLPYPILVVEYSISSLTYN